MSVWLKKLEKLEEKLSQGKQKEAKHKNKSVIYLIEGFPGGSDGKESVCNAVDPGLVPGWGRSPGEGNGYSLQYSCLKISMDRGAWWATVYEVSKNQTQLSD